MRKGEMKCEGRRAEDICYMKVRSTEVEERGDDVRRGRRRGGWGTLDTRRQS